MKPKKDKVTVQIDYSGYQGNAYYILEEVSSKLKKAGFTDTQVEDYKKEATSGDYENLKKVTEEWANVI